MNYCPSQSWDSYIAQYDDSIYCPECSSGEDKIHSCGACEYDSFCDVCGYCSNCLLYPTLCTLVGENNANHQ